MNIFGWYVCHEVATDLAEAKLWCNTIHGNRHQRIVSLERVISDNNEVAYALFVGKHAIKWIRFDQSKYRTTIKKPTTS